MLQKSIALGLAFSICIAVPVAAQQWISRLPQKSPQELTLTDFRQAFKDFYKSDTEMVRAENIRPIFRFDQPAEAQRKKNIEEIKMFKRWEWLMEPRMYPSGRLDLERIGQIRARLERDDDDLVFKQRDKNPLNVRFEANKIIWPPIMIWTSLGPSDAVGGTNLGRVNCIEFEPGNTNTLYIGAPDGGVWKSVDGGANWTTKFGAQPTLSVGDIAIDKTNTKIVYAATSDAFGYGIVYENNAKNALYVGTDASVYYINDDLSDWVPYKLGMPNVIVDDLEIHYGTKKIRAATYGRGIWQAALKSL